MRNVLLGLVLGFAAALPATADVLLIAPSAPLTRGSQVTVQVMFTNPGDVGRDITVPTRVEYRLVGNSAPVEGNLVLVNTANAGVRTLNAGAFEQHAYELNVPGHWRGVGRLALSLPDNPTTLVEIAAPNVQMANLADMSLDLSEDDDGVVDAIVSAVDEVYEPDSEGPFGIHEPMYFVYGTNPDEMKFQISFKYRLFHNIKDTSPLRWLQNLNVGYTQLSFWDFDSASKPFRDSSYKPEVFYDIGDPTDPDGLILPGLGLRHVRIGMLHESNGRDGAASRSLNYAYLQPEFVYDFDRPVEDCGDCEWWELSVRPKVWTYVGSTSDNPTIDDFRGHAEVAVRLMERNEQRQTGVGLMASLRKGDAHDKATLQIDATTPFPFVQKLFTPNLYAQFISGYSESLLGFNQKDTRFRVGLGTRW
ncbi:MAG: hypothetical protein GKS03_05430 [Alphaproteobacteria bacterium]|nr:hypothetical protein [Alphaproteobacteria bacterium]